MKSRPIILVFGSKSTAQTAQLNLQYFYEATDVKHRFVLRHGGDSRGVTYQILRISVDVQVIPFLEGFLSDLSIFTYLSA
jgi:hypothetical protein